ncbi:response regulator transcription factor [Pseudodesulfovibrio sediminis]|uniref:DNA-binding response regulator n=1 Tax=Pseudodesulfovibrio sediminis TaxID=2810563 RepID=A0ABM7P238_9BACT|nr:response regulator transcription factor [Pseudodesulfovibrio sediminis]BCS86852.1 DNA-binding response regulator [Pseudodesulfovibrio sediminis]
MTEVSQRVQVLLADDHPAVRQGLTILLESANYTIAREVGSCAEAKLFIETGRFQLAVLDLSMEDGSGIDLLADLSANGIAVLVYSMHEEPETINHALRCGARGYVTKREEPEVVLDGAEAVLDGERFISPRCTQVLTENSGRIEDEVPLFVLSDREKDIFAAMGAGESNIDIAEKMNISPRTVETYMSRIVNKLGVESVPALRKLAIYKAVIGV